MAEKFIIELDRNEIEFLAAITHYYLRSCEGDETALAIIEELKMQTNFVYSDPTKHGISSSLVMYNKTTATKWGSRVYEYLDGMTGLSDIMNYNLGD